jgi:hypothetical protein
MAPTKANQFWVFGAEPAAVSTRSLERDLEKQFIHDHPGRRIFGVLI